MKRILPFFKTLGFLLVICSAINAQTPQKSDPDDLETLFNKYKTERKKPCGERQEAVRIGKLLFEKFRYDEESELVKRVHNDTLKIEKEDVVCRRESRYNNAYKTKNWDEFFAISKEFIAEEGDSPFALDVILTLVSVGYDRVVVDRRTEYIEETLFFALKAINLLEKGVKSANGRYGVFAPFSGRRGYVPGIGKSEIWGWCYFVIGSLKYDWQGKTDRVKKDEAIPYFYKAIQKDGMKNHIPIYKTISEYYLEKVCFKWNGKEFVVTDEKALGNLERAIDIIARGRKNALYNSRTTEPFLSMDAQVKQLFNFRFNLPANFVYENLESFLDKLASAPLPDPQTEIKPTWERPLDLKTID